MEALLVGGAVFFMAYATLSRKEEGRAKPATRKDPRPFEEGVVVTTNVRSRMHESVGTGAEIGAHVGIYPNDDGLEHEVPTRTLPTAPFLNIDGGESTVEAPELPDLTVVERVQTAVMPKREPIFGDPNSLHQGSITVVPARLRGPFDEPPRNEPRVTLQPVNERDEGEAVQVGGWESGVDWRALEVDHEAAKERLRTVSSEPGDQVKADAARKQAEALVVPPQLDPTIEERVDMAITTLGGKEYFADVRRIGRPGNSYHRKLEATYMEHRHSRVLKPAVLVATKVASHKLGVIHPLDPKLREILFIMGVIPTRPVIPKP